MMKNEEYSIAKLWYEFAEKSGTLRSTPEAFLPILKAMFYTGVSHGLSIASEIHTKKIHEDPTEFKKVLLKLGIEGVEEVQQLLKGKSWKNYEPGK